MFRAGVNHKVNAQLTTLIICDIVPAKIVGMLTQDSISAAPSRTKIASSYSCTDVSRMRTFALKHFRLVQNGVR